MSVTPNLGLTQIVQAQSQKEVVIDANNTILDGFVLKRTGDTGTGSFILTRTAATTGTPLPVLKLLSPADTGVANANQPFLLWDFTTNPVQLLGGAGAIAGMDLATLNLGLTLNAAAAQTITAAAGLHIVGGPTAGTNVTITNGNTCALQVQGSICFGDNVAGSNHAGFTFQQARNASQYNEMVIKPKNNGNPPASTESTVLLVDSAANGTVTWSTGSLAVQRENYFTAPTYAALGASTFTDVATVAITGAPVAGANMTLPSSYALWVQAGGARIQGHLNLAGGNAPTAAAGSNNGTTPPAPVVTAGANDTRGNCTFGSGTGPAAGNQLVVSFNNLPQAFTSAPTVMVIPKNSATAALNLYVTSVSTNGFTVASVNAPAVSQGASTYSADFIALQ